MNRIIIFVVILLGVIIGLSIEFAVEGQQLKNDPTIDCINAKFVTMFRQFSFHLKEFGFASVSFHKWVRFKPDPFGLFN